MKPRFFLGLFVLGMLICFSPCVSADNDLFVSTSQTLPAGTYTYGNVTVTNGATLTLQSDTSQSGFMGVNLTANKLTIDPGSSISADGQGYGSDSGPGTGAASGGGGGYGGAGSQGTAGSGGLPYGSALQPSDPGSGGARGTAWSQGSSDDPGGRGGGAIRLIVSDTLTNNGLVTANGADGTPGNFGAGAGSGGSIWVTTNALAGNGMFSARGGNGSVGMSNGGGGGGGRIMMYETASSFSGTTVVTGGTGNNRQGENGTSGTVNTGTNDFSSDSNWNFLNDDGPVFHFHDVVFRNAYVTFNKNTTLNAGSMTLINSTIISVPEWGLTLDLGELTLDSASTISVNGQGYGSDSGPGTGAASGGGGGYGGAGSQGTAGSGGLPYGSALQPSDPGSGGARGTAWSQGSSDDPGGRGGGAIRLIVSDTLTNNGLVTANGADGTPGNFGAGAGSGGSIWVATDSLAGNGVFSARGGNGSVGMSNGGGGGGGRIMMYETASSFSGTTVVTGGTGNNRQGENGTSGTVNTGTNDFSSDSNWNFLNDDGPVFHFHDVVFRNAHVTFNKNTTLNAGSLTLINSTIISVPEWGLNLNLGELTLDSASTISVNGQGYASDSGPGTGAVSGGGGGYGGTGGLGSSGSGGLPYGSALQPSDPGSGGARGTAWSQGSSDDPGGRGGGAIRLIVSDTLTNNGLVTANGADGTPGTFGAGAGSGGSIWVATNSLAGNGVFSAGGGNGAVGGVTGGSGGGGRIAIYYQVSQFIGEITVPGGNSGAGSGTKVFTDKNTLGNDFNVNMNNVTTSHETVDLTDKSFTGTGPATVNDTSVGTLSFDTSHLVRFTSGSFKDQGFMKGQWDATLYNSGYSGTWNGTLYHEHVNDIDVLFIRGTTDGSIYGVLDGDLIESVNGSGVYDRYNVTWNIMKINGVANPQSVELSGQIQYNGDTMYPLVNTEYFQSAVQGTSTGSYSGPINLMLTHVAVISPENPFYGDGFSRMSYTTGTGTGNAWTYDSLSGPGVTKLQGELSGLLLGRVTGYLYRTSDQPWVSLSTERFDEGTGTSPLLSVWITSPRAASPGETITYLIEWENDGFAAADDMTILWMPSFCVDPLIGPAGSTYDTKANVIRFDLPTIPPMYHGKVPVEARVMWGLPAHLEIPYHFLLIVPSDEADSLLGTNVYQVTSGPTSGLSSTSRTHIFSDTSGTTTTYQSKGWWSTFCSHAEVFFDWLGNMLPSSFTSGTVTPAANVVLAAEQNTDKEYSVYVNTMLRKALIDHDEAAICFFLDLQTIDPLTFSQTHSGSLPQYIEEKRKNCHYEPRCLIKIPTVDWFHGGGYVNGTTPTFQSSCPSCNSAKVFGNGSSSGNGGGSGNCDDPPDILVAGDPNSITGPSGHVPAGERLDYRIEFENVGEGTAYGVYFVEHVDENYDDSTLDIGAVYSTTNGSVIAPAGTYDSSTRTITWIVGEVGSKAGGYANVSATLKSGLVRGTFTVNQGIVYFPSVPEVTPTNVLMTIIGVNHAPYQPVITSPSSGSANVMQPVNLSWTCSDPDGDPVSYDIYFSNSSAVTRVGADYYGTTLALADVMNGTYVNENGSLVLQKPAFALENNTQYFWKIVARDTDGLTSEGPLWNFTLAPGPDEGIGITSITPNSCTSGKSVAISNLSGYGFTPGSSSTNVTMNKSGQANITATNVTVVSGNQITCNFTIPLGSATGKWNITVTVPGKQATILQDGFLVTAPAPTISGITPPTGVNTTTVSVTNLSGTNFAPGATVRLNRSGYADIPGSGVTVINSSSITCTFDLAGRTAGRYTVVVTNGDGQSGILENGFNVTAPSASPTISGVSPAQGPTTGGTRVLITGTSLAGATAVTFGGIAATSFTVINNTAISAVSPAYSTPTAVSIVVTTAGGTATGTGVYTYTPLPVITSFTPVSATRGTATNLVFYGNYFQTGATAKFTQGSATVPVTIKTVTEPSKITGSVTFPSSASAGKWNIVIQNPDGGEVTRANVFTVK